MRSGITGMTGIVEWPFILKGELSDIAIVSPWKPAIGRVWLQEPSS